MKNETNSNTKLDDLIQQINKLEIENKTLKKSLSLCLNSITPWNKTKESITSNKNIPAKDAKGNTLLIGQKVKFITKGKYHATEGVIKSIKATRVISVDNKNIKIVRSHKNIEAIPKGDK